MSIFTFDKHGSLLTYTFHPSKLVKQDEKDLKEDPNTIARKKQYCNVLCVYTLYYFLLRWVSFQVPNYPATLALEPCSYWGVKIDPLAALTSPAS